MRIDWWTLGFQTVNILILIWLLGRFFWRPVAAIIAQRNDTAAHMLTEAETARKAAADALSGIEKTRAGFAAERAAILAAAQKDAETATAARAEDARKAADALLASAKAAAATDHAAAEKAWTVQSSHLAIDIAGRLAARLDGPAVQAAFLDWLLAEIRTMPDDARRAVDGVALQAVSAAPLPAPAQESYRTAIDAAFGVHPTIAFSADPALIAGLELRGPHFALTNSWRADLAKLQADLIHDAGQ